LQKESTLRTLKRDPQFAALLNAYLLSRVIRVEEDLADQSESSAEKTLDRGPGSEATGTDGLFSSIAVSRPSFWKALKREK
jgi:hypothetical protein